MPRLDDVPHGPHQIRASSWAGNITSLCQTPDPGRKHCMLVVGVTPHGFLNQTIALPNLLGPEITRLDVRHTTSSAFKRIKVWQAAKSRRYTGQPHGLSAAWAKRGSWRVFMRAFVMHGQKLPEPIRRIGDSHHLLDGHRANVTALECGRGEGRAL